MVLEAHKAIPSMPAKPAGSPYWVGRDGPPPPAPATAKPLKDIPRRVSTPVAIPPLEATSTPHFTPKTKPAGSR